MIYELVHWIQAVTEGTEWEPFFSPLRIFSYITFRSLGASLTALMLGLWLGPKVIAWLQRVKFGQDYQDKAEEAGAIRDPKLSKRGTPTMGGILIFLVLEVSTVLWVRFNDLILLTLLSVVVLAALGFYDDYLKVLQKNADGVSEGVKWVVQLVMASFIAGYLWLTPSRSVLVSEIMIPFYKSPILEGMVVLGVLLTLVTIVGSSNAVNLTDGLDGLAMGCTLIVTAVFGILTYLAGNFRLSEYLQIPYVAGAGELTVFCSAMFGTGLAFLWYNCYPARVFMGDTGSLALGGALGIMAVLIHQPFVLFIAGGVFVMEAGSVILQRGYFKWTRYRTGTGKRVFLMAPIHHHFEKKGWYESQVVTRFYIIGILFALIALSSLKIR